jgi:hypothetical protein
MSARDRIGEVRSGSERDAASRYDALDELRNALVRTDQALRAVLAGTPVRDADEILSANSWILFAEPSDFRA